MDDQAVSASTAPPPAPPREAAEPAPLWHLGWTIGVVAAGAGLLAGLGAISWPTLIALAAGAAAGLLGYLWRPVGKDRLGLLVVWGLGVVLGAALEGGLTGPLGLWCAMPVLAGSLIGATAEGAVIGAAALAVTVLIQLAGVAVPAPTGLFGLGVSAAGLLTVGGAAVGVLAILGRRARERAAASALENDWLSGMMSELPHLALALDRQGLPEAVFGAPLAGLAVDGLRQGLVAAVHPDDRETVKAAICEAFDHGFGEAVFRPAAAPERQVTVSLRRRAEDGLTALVREAIPAGVSPLAAAAPSETALVEVADPTAAPGDALALAIQAREAAEAAKAAVDSRAEDLEQQLKVAQKRRKRALAAQAAAEATQAAAEAARDDAEANANGKSRFLANMSHELRTPLNAIMGFSDIMRTRMFGDLPPRYAEYAEMIHESGRHLTDLINDVLDMSKIEAERYTLSYEVFDAREAINAALRLVRLQADDAGVTLRGLSPSAPLMVEADRRALKQIVLNLVSNALKFTPREGSVTVTAQPVDGMFELVVADTGVGIAKADLERLGRPFEQAGDAEHKAQGTGLGLSLVKAFAGLHGGAMNIESAPGEGAAVTVRLPVLVVEEPAAETPVAEPEAAPVVAPPAADEPQPMTVVAADLPFPAEPERPRMGEVIPLNLNR